MKTSDGRLAKAKAIDLRGVIQIEGASRGSNYVHGYCPVHEADGREHKSKSFLVYPNHYICLSAKCGVSGDIINWFAYKMFGDPKESLKDGRFNKVLDAILGSRFETIKTEPVIQKPITVRRLASLTKAAEEYHAVLMSNPDRLTYFFSRGFRLRTIVRQMWGWDGSRYVITVWRGTPRKSKLVSIRFRSSSKEDTEFRYTGVKEFNPKVLYNREALLYAKRKDLPLLGFYGEFDAQLAWQSGIPTVSPTNGARSFDVGWLGDFGGDVVIVPDKGEEQEAYKDAAALGGRGWVVSFPKGDFKDFTEMAQRNDPCRLFKAIYRETSIGYYRRFCRKRFFDET